MTETDRKRLRAAAHDLLCTQIGALSIARLCVQCGSAEHGRPVALGNTNGVQVSISYAADLVAVAWTGEGAVGIDIEHDGPGMKGVGSPQEWTRLEAMAKATGLGLTGEMAALPEQPTETLHLPPGYVGSIAGSRVSWRLAGPAAPVSPATH